jgi:hypothetical protein
MNHPAIDSVSIGVSTLDTAQRTTVLIQLVSFTEEEVKTALETLVQRGRLVFVKMRRHSSGPTCSLELTWKATTSGQLAFPDHAVVLTAQNTPRVGQPLDLRLVFDDHAQCDQFRLWLFAQEFFTAQEAP